MAVSLSSIDGNGDASKSLTVSDGKKRRPITAGMLIRTSNAKAFWMIEGIVKEDVSSQFYGHPCMIKRLTLLLAHEVTDGMRSALLRMEIAEFLASTTSPLRFSMHLVSLHRITSDVPLVRHECSQWAVDSGSLQ